jgi:hypothetical protein
MFRLFLNILIFLLQWPFKQYLKLLIQLLLRMLIYVIFVLLRN